MELFATEYLASQYFWTTVAFVMLLGVVWRFVVPAVNAALDARAAQIKGDLHRAREEREAAERVLAEYQQQLAAARKEAAQVVSTARAEAEALATRRLAEVEAEIARKGEDKPCATCRPKWPVWRWRWPKSFWKAVWMPSWRPN